MGEFVENHEYFRDEINQRKRITVRHDFHITVKLSDHDHYFLYKFYLSKVESL